MKKIYLYLVIIVVSIMCGVGLCFFTKSEKQDELLGDYSDYVFSFDEVTIPNEKLVIFDNNNLDYLRYYVVDFSGEQYILYSYYFMKNHDNYIKKYSEVSSLICDYNYSEFMIKTIEEIDYGTYDDFLLKLEDVLKNDLMYIIY